MEYQYNYANLAEKAQQVIKGEGLGYRQLHDTFDGDWQPGDEPHGTLIFTDEHKPPTILPESIDIEVEINSLKVRVDALEKKVKP